MPAPQKELDLGSEGCERGLRLEQRLMFRRIFALPDREPVRVLLPAGADIVPVTEEAFIAGNVFGNGLARVIASPRRRVERLLLRARLKREDDGR